jgi:hypothetical protein
MSPCAVSYPRAAPVSNVTNLHAVYPSVPIGPPRVVVNPGSVAGEYLPVGVSAKVDYG